MAAFCPVGYAFEGHGSPPPVDTYMCLPTEFGTIYAQIISKKCMQILPCIDKLYGRLKNIPESESRQFYRLRHRLRLLAHCHDSGRLRLRLRLRLRTPAQNREAFREFICHSRRGIFRTNLTERFQLHQIPQRAKCPAGVFGRTCPAAGEGGFCPKGQNRHFSPYRLLETGLITAANPNSV